MLNFTKQFEAPLPQKSAITSKTKDIFIIVSCISQMCIKFRTFGKKDEYSSLVISKVIDSGRGGYFNV